MCSFLDRSLILPVAPALLPRCLVSLARLLKCIIRLPVQKPAAAPLSSFSPPGGAPEPGSLAASSSSPGSAPTPAPHPPNADNAEHPELTTGFLGWVRVWLGGHSSCCPCGREEGKARAWAGKLPGPRQPALRLEGAPWEGVGCARCSLFSAPPVGVHCFHPLPTHLATTSPVTLPREVGDASPTPAPSIPD